MKRETNFELLERLRASDDLEGAVLESTLALIQANDPQFAHAVRVCAIPRRLNADIVGVLMGTSDDRIDNGLIIEKLAAMSFVIRREDGDLAFHDNVRNRLLESWFDEESRSEFDALTADLVAYHEAVHSEITDLERSLMRVSPVIRRVSEDRFAQLTHTLESRLLTPLLDAVYHSALVSIEDAYDLFGRYVENYELAGRIGVCRALVGALRDQLAQSDEAGAANRLLWLDYWEGRLARDAGDAVGAEATLRAVDPGDDVRLRMWILGDLGAALAERDLLVEAREVYEEELALAEATQADLWNLAISYWRIAGLAWQMDDLPKALELYQRAIPVASEQDNDVAEVLALLDGAGVLAQLGKPEDAFEVALKALDIARTRQPLDRALQQSVAIRFMLLFAPYEPRLVETLQKEAHAVQPPQDARSATGFEVTYLDALREARRTVSAEEAYELAGRPTRERVGPWAMDEFLVAQAFHADERGEYGGAIAAFGEVLNAPDAAPSHRAASLFYRGVDLADCGRLDDASVDIEASVPVWEAMGNDAMVAMAHVQIASIRIRQGRLEDAQAILGEWGHRAAAIASAVVADYHKIVGDFHFARGEFDRAAEAHQLRFEALVSRERIGAGDAANDLAKIFSLRGQWADAAHWCARAAEVWRRVREAAAYRKTRNQHVVDRQNADAVRIFSSPDGDLRAVRDLLLSASEAEPDNVWFALNLAHAAASLGDWGDAAEAAERAYANAPVQAPALLGFVAQQRLRQAEALLAQDDPVRALAICRAVLDLGEAVSADYEAVFRERAGDAEHALGHSDAAAAEYRAAADTSSPRRRGSALSRLAAVEAGRGRRDAAIALLSDAITAFVAAGDDTDAWWSAVAGASEVGGERIWDVIRPVFQELVKGGRVTTFSSELTVPLPPGWLARDTVSFISPDGLAHLTVSGEPIEDALTLQEYADQNASSMPFEESHAQDYSFERTILTSGHEALIRRFSWITDDDMPVARFEVFFLAAGRAYTASGASFHDAGGVEEQLLELARAIAVNDAAEPLAQ